MEFKWRNPTCAGVFSLRENLRIPSWNVFWGRFEISWVQVGQIAWKAKLFSSQKKVGGNIRRHLCTQFSRLHFLFRTESRNLFQLQDLSVPLTEEYGRLLNRVYVGLTLYMFLIDRSPLEAISIWTIFQLKWLRKITNFPPLRLFGNRLMKNCLSFN